jgi:hypothetical protein
MTTQPNSRFNEEGFAEQQEGWSERYRDMTASAIDEYPLSTTIGVFAVGLSVGMLIGSALARPMQPRHRQVAESLGRRVLEAVQEYAPASVQKYLPS